jgi:hypothetical protein
LGLSNDLRWDYHLRSWFYSILSWKKVEELAPGIAQGMEWAPPWW